MITEEDKKLLLKDLCARLPYKVKAQYFDEESGRYEIDTIDGIDLTDKPEILISQYGLKVDAVKQYLRPMSSMTEEERAEYFTLKHRDKDRVDNIILISEASALMDWLNKEGFDYYGLIEKGLALEAPEGMYNTKTE